MTQQTFSVGREPRIVLTTVQGDLTIRTWQEQAVLVDIDGYVSGLQQEGNALMITDCDSDIELRVPEDATITVTNALGEVDIEGVRQVKIENAASDVSLKDISGDAEVENADKAIEITNLGGDLDVTNSPALRVRHSVGGDATLKDVALVEIETVGGGLSVENAETVVVSTVGGDLDGKNVMAGLRCGVIGGDCEVQGGAQVEVVVGNVGGDCTIGSAASVQGGNVGGDCELRDAQGDVELAYTGGDIHINGVGGNLKVGNCGGDAVLRGIMGGLEFGSIGGDLELQSAFAADTRTRLIVGGDASIVLPDEPNVSIRATVGGDIRGRSIISSRSGNLVNLTYGNGAAHLDLNVGGDLNLKGAGSPRSSSSASSSWNDFGHEMSQLGRDLGQLGQDLSREIASAFSEAGWSKGANIADDMARKAEERAGRAQRHAEEQARRAQQRAERINIRFNDREWRLDPQRLERIREQAHRAASEGIAGAYEAVERAMSNLHIPVPSAPPVPPMPPMPPQGMPPVPPMPSAPANPMSGAQASTTGDPGQQASTRAADTSTSRPQASMSGADLDQEREAILRMIAEGRVTPEEGDLLLEALGS